MTGTVDDKEAFYLSLLHRPFSPFQASACSCDFIAHVGLGTAAWPKIFGRHSVSRENSNGT